MLRIAATSLFAMFMSQPALAKHVFQCAVATVTIGVDATLPLRSTEGADVILSVEKAPDQRLYVTATLISLAEPATRT